MRSCDVHCCATIALGVLSKVSVLVFWTPSGISERARDVCSDFHDIYDICNARTRPRTCTRRCTANIEMRTCMCRASQPRHPYFYRP